MRTVPPSPPASEPLAARAGIGLKPQHYCDVLGEGGIGFPGWVEIHPQNYFADGGPALRWLEAVAERYPLSFHSTGLSLGSAEGPSRDDLERLARLAERFNPALVSDHLSWSVSGSEQFPDLLPLPYDEPTLAHMARSVDMVQQRLGRMILIENPSRYLAFAYDTMGEVDFLHRLCSMTGCGMLFDINNVAVSARNLGFDAAPIVDAVDPALVHEIHLAGHALEDHGDFTLAIDDHGSEVAEATWALYGRFIARAGPKPTLIEWDSDVPDYAVLMAEAERADRILLDGEACDVRAA